MARGTASKAAYAVKTERVDEIRDRLRSSTATVLTEYRGLTVSELADLRAKLRENDAEYKVVKNTLTKLAARDAGLELPDELLTGPTAITFAAGDPVAVAKVLRQFSKDNPELVIKAGILEGRLLDASETLQLAELESRDEMLAKLAGMMQSIIAQPARLAHASLAKMARLLAAYQDKKAQEPQPEPAPAPATESVEAETTPEPEATPDEPAAETTPEPEATSDEPAAETTPEPEASPDEKTEDASKD